MEQFLFSLGAACFIFYLYALFKQTHTDDKLIKLYEDYKNATDKSLLYCEELNRTADIKAWKSYAKSLTTSKPMQKDLDMLSKPQFILEMYAIYNLTLKEI